MKVSQNTNVVFKAAYEEPDIEIICFSCEDILTTSGGKDENQGEWDPQKVNSTF